MEEDIKILEEAIGILEEMLEEAKIKNIKILLPVEERAIQNIIQAYKDQKCKADIQDATIKNMKDFMEQLEKENEQLEEKVEQQRQQIEEMLEANIRRAEDEFEALSWEE